MKRVLLLGCLGIGMMSFAVNENIQTLEGDVDCFAKANAAVKSTEEHSYFLHPIYFDAIWDDVFYNCSAANSQLLNPVTVTISEN
ncbi:hypothetical protein [Nonlabens antarcticus]|uniref:hypothetical protein n=1 Tax=Nonlabens antarcticus TaxID=392714 RepID=UPI0018919255|nr:hypothetical protein [Nonlabens antarcticus]